MATPNSIYSSSLDTFRNIIWANNIALETHFADLILNGDTTRIVYSNNNHCFRKRVAKQEVTYGNLNLPFMNYYPVDIQQDVERTWFNNVLNIEGIYVEELERKLRLNPIKIIYEATLFVRRPEELLYCTNQLLFDDSNETVLNPEIEFVLEDESKVSMPISSVLGYDFSFNSQFEENDWLEKNQIMTMGLDFSFDTFSILDNNDVSITDEVIFQFLSHKGIIDYDSPLDSEAYVLLEEYFT